MSEIRWDQATDDEFVGWMMDLLDEGPDRLAVIEIPPGPGAVMDALEDRFLRAYERAKRDRPNLAIKLHPPTEEFPDAAGLIILHEHRWIGGLCVNGCRNQRPLDSLRGSA